MLAWGFFRVALGFLEGLFVVDFPLSHVPMISLILFPAFRGDWLFVGDFLFSPGFLDSPARGERLFVVDFLFSQGFLDSPSRGDGLFVDDFLYLSVFPGVPWSPLGFRWVTDSLLLTFCLPFMVSLHPVLVFSGDWLCPISWLGRLGRLTRGTDSVLTQKYRMKQKGNQEIRKPGNRETRKPGKGDQETRKPGNRKTEKGNQETRKPWRETGKQKTLEQHAKYAFQNELVSAV